MPRPDDVISSAAADRIERHLSELTQAVNRLVLIDERQVNQAKRLDAIEVEQEAQSARILKVQTDVSRFVWIGSALYLAGLFVMWLIERGVFVVSMHHG